MAHPKNKLKYFLTVVVTSDYYELFPLGESSFSIVQELVNDENNPRYGYDIKFTGSFIFVGEDFAILKELEEGGYRCTELLFTLHSDGCDGVFDSIFPYTKLRLSDGKWELDKCMVTLPVVNRDPYECINQKAGDKLNIFSAASPVAVKLADITPVFEYSYFAANNDGQDITTQSFAHYPNRKAQYPGFSVDGQTADPYWPESESILFVNADLADLVRDPVTYEEYLSTGSIPQHADFPTYSGAYDAIAVGWRLYSFRYEIFNSVGTGGTLGEHRRFRWCREILDLPSGSPSPGIEWVYVGVIVGTDDRWARAPTLVPRTNHYDPAFVEVAFPTEKIIKYVQTTYIVGAVTNVVNIYDEIDEPGGSGSNGNIYGFDALPNGIPLNEIITYAAGYCCPDLTVKSEFFQINPDVVTDINPISGEESFTNRLMVFQKSDVKRPFASEHATKGEFTFSELFDWLLKMYKVKYCIFGDELRIEHVTSPLFVKPATIDLTVPPLNKYTAGTRTYTYESGILPGKWTFKFMETNPSFTFLPTDDFAGVPILFYGECVNRDDKSGVFPRVVDRVSTDIMYILKSSGGISRVIDNKTSNPYVVYEDAGTGAIDDDGFCIVAYQDIGGTLYGVKKDPILDTLSRLNNVVGWAYLHKWFHTFDGNALDGNVNLVDVTFPSTKYVKKQIPLTFVKCCILDFDPYEQITTALGTGVAKKITWKPTGMMEVEVYFQLT